VWNINSNQQNFTKLWLQLHTPCHIECREYLSPYLQDGRRMLNYESPCITGTQTATFFLGFFLGGDTEIFVESDSCLRY